MLNTDGDGIICDYCGDKHAGDFLYYSFDFRHIMVRSHQTSVLEGDTFTADLCLPCIEAYKARVSKAYRPPDGRKLYCDISGEVISGSDTEYYVCTIAKLDVRFTGQSYICNICNKSVSLEDGPCPECPQENKVVREALVNKDDEHFEFTFSKRMFNLFREHVDTIKKKGVEEWAKT